jgi:hypothetical protein
MKNFNLFIIGTGLFFTTGVSAQVTVKDNHTLSLGSTLFTIGTGNVGTQGDASGVKLGGDTGLIIEQGYQEVESDGSGIYLNGDHITMWSPADDYMVAFCDEDMMSGASFFTEAIVAYIDGEGYYYQVSDSTCKEDIQNLSSPLSKVLQLRGVEYYHKTIEKKNNTTLKSAQTKEKKAGFLAQEVESIIPEAVSENPNGKKYVNYQAMIPFLVEAVKEQQVQIAQQQLQIKQMQEKMASIEQALSLRKTN